jgi:hypothetical protein
LVELVKRSLQDDQGNDRLPKQLMPLLGVLFGVAINVGVAVYQQAPMVPALFVGVGVGLMGSGLYSGAKALVGR